MMLASISCSFAGSELLPDSEHLNANLAFESLAAAVEH
jgi:hypothetical protein